MTVVFKNCPFLWSSQ
uniref:Uncharacterized protein n=1 Tax=Anguilla anguilla TaxID=7936 RepID=A0A0E9TSZ4_ANGAN